MRLEMVNDGARSPDVAGDGRGGGLAGLTERARAAAGSSSAGPLDGGRFRVVIDVPEFAEVVGGAP